MQREWARRGGVVLGKTSLGLAAACAVVWLVGLYPLVQFPQESIQVDVYPNRVEVTGEYEYRNPLPLPVRQGFSIPLPADAVHPLPVRLSLAQRAPAVKPIPTGYWLGRHRFDLAFAGDERIRVRLCYEQYCPDNDARYILTTTRAWRHPLQRGTYRLVPHGVRIVASNYALAARPAAGQGALGFEREHFWPEQDWRFAWEINPSERNLDYARR